MWRWTNRCTSNVCNALCVLSFMRVCVCVSCLHLSVGRCMACLAATVVAVVGTQAWVLQGAVGAGGGGAAAAVRVTQTLTVLLMDLQKNNHNSTEGRFEINMYTQTLWSTLNTWTMSSITHTHPSVVYPSILTIFNLLIRNIRHVVSLEHESTVVTFFCRAQWKMKINMPWKALKVVKR